MNTLCMEPWQVRAVLAGKKTEHRVLVPVQPVYDGQGLWHVLYPWGEGGHGIYESAGELYGEYSRMMRHRAPHTPGALCWVKEPVFLVTGPDVGGWVYEQERLRKLDGHRYRRVPAVRMKQHQSRLTVRITTLAVARLHDLTEEQARDGEGIAQLRYQDGSSLVEGYAAAGTDTAHKLAYAAFWDDTHPHATWDDNPFVYVLGLAKVKDV